MKNYNLSRIQINPSPSNGGFLKYIGIFVGVLLLIWAIKMLSKTKEVAQNESNPENQYLSRLT